MRPGNALERRVESLAASLKDLTPAGREWGLSHIIPHWCIYRTRSHKCTCVACGHTWKEKAPKRCPHCGAKLTLLNDSRKRRFIEHRYYGIVQKVQEFSVLRLFYIYDNRKLGEGAATAFFEVLQHWISEDGKDTIRARNLAMFPYYRACPFSLYTDLSLKRDANWHGYRNTYYHFSPDAFHPRMKYSEILSRNGFKGDFYGLCPEDVFCHLLTDNRLHSALKEKGYRIALMLPFTIEKYLPLFASSDVITLCPTNVSSETELVKKASLLITDYSDLQFRFAYLNKPICYYFPQGLPIPQELKNEGLADNCFGKLFFDHEKLVDHLIHEIGADFPQPEPYQKMCREFFAYHDKHNCRRILNTVKEVFLSDTYKNQ